MARAFSLRCAGFAHTCLVAALGILFSGLLWAQAPNKFYLECNHDSLITVLRAYEDSLALAGSTTVLRVDYAWLVTDVAVVGKVYKIYRCEALYDSLEVLMDEVAFARMTPPTVDTDSIGSISGTGATFYGKVTSDGDTAVTAQWFKYGLSAGSLSDSLAVSGVVTPFSAVATGLANGTTYYVAAFAENVKGTAPGDTLSFTTHAAPTVDTDAASSVTSTAATLNATITATGGAAVSATGFKYATNSALTTPSDAAGSGTSSPFTGSLTSLTPGTQYWAVGYATNSVGTSYGDTITFTTNAVAPTVDTDAASSVTSTAATLNATITATGGAAVTATGFKYATNALLTSPTDVAGSGTSSPFTGSLTGLTASTQYWAVGYATNAVGTSYGDTITFTTSAPPFTCGTSTVTYDGYNYATVQIGSQCWFKENLRNDDYNDATPIPGNLDDATWTTTTSGAQTVYGEGSSAVYDGSSDEAANLATYGRLYNWYAVNTGKLCPSGWHVPTDAEWTTLADTLGGSSVAGTKLKASSSNTPAWNGDNTSGFSALPGGFRYDAYGYFNGQGYVGSWWSSSPNGTGAWLRSLDSGYSNVFRNTTGARRGFSVRCVRD